MKLCPICKRSWDDEYRVCPIDGLALQAAAVEADPHAGQMVAQCRIGEKIADGDQGPIYRADDPVRGPIAVQFILADRLASPVLLEAFEDAVKMAARVDHPNVIRVFGLERCNDGSAAVLMEYVPGDHLAAYRQDHPSLDIQHACDIIKEAAQGVLAAHRMSILHGSLHPTRIVLASDGRVKVGGFHRSGIRDEDFSPTSEAPGLPYLAPERTGIVRDIPVPDYRADVYSLGAILYELITGKTPYDTARTLQDLNAAMNAGPPLPPSFTNPQVSPTLSRVVLKSLSLHAGDRHRSAEEFIRELEAASQPMRAPERDIAADNYLPPSQATPRDDSGLFAPPHPKPRQDSIENIWPEATKAKQSGEGSMFSWFKTRADSRPRASESPRERHEPEDSFFPRRSGSRADDVSGERTVLVSGRKSRSRRRSFSDTFASFGRFGDQTGTGTGTLPRRRFSSKAYIWMGVAAAAVVTAAIALFFLFGRPETGKLLVESTPSGAQIFLNEEYRGNTPMLIPEIKADMYHLRLQLDGYESVAADVEVGPDSDVQKSFILSKMSMPPLAAPFPSDEVLDTTPSPPPLTPDTTPKVPYESMFNDAIRARNFLPPTSGNAWDILQSWQQKESASPPAALTQAKQSFCRELETLGLEKLDQRDFQFVRNLLEQVRTRMPGESCAGGLQTRFDAAISRSIADLRTSLSAAMNRQSYVTPESDNALKYARLILHIDSQDVEAKTIESELYTRSLDQAKAKSQARDHQEALNIYTQLRTYYPNPPGGQELINKGIEREKRKLALLSELKVPYSVSVKHSHSFFRLKNRECTGILRADGFNIEYQSNGDHSFKVAYDALSSISYSNGKITLEGGLVPDHKIELEQADRNPSPSLAEVYAKIEEYRKLREQYLRAD